MVLPVWRRNRWQLWGLAGFAVIYPLLSAPEPYLNNLVKSRALTAVALLLAGLLLVPVLHILRPSTWGRAGRLSLGISAVLGVYAVILGGVRLESVAILLLLPVLALFLAQPANSPWLTRPVRDVTVSLVVVVVATCFLSAHQYVALFGHPYRRTGLATFCACVVVFLAGLRFLANRDDARFMVRCLVLGSVPVALLALVQFFDTSPFTAGFFTSLVRDPRPMGTLGQTNWFGTYLLLLFPFAVHWAVNERSWRWAGLAGLLYASLLVAQTRGAWVAALSFMLVHAWHLRREWRPLAGLALWFALLTAVLVPWNHRQILDRVGSFQDEAGLALQGQAGTGSGRFSFWRYALHHVPSRALLGSGLDTFGELGTRDLPAPVSKAHSVYLEYAVTIGLIGLCCWMAFLWYCFGRASPTPGPLPWRFVLGTYWVQGLFIHDTIQTWPLLWLLAAAAVAASRNRQASDGSRHGCETVQGTVDRAIRAEDGEPRAEESRPSADVGQQPPNPNRCHRSIPPRTPGAVDTSRSAFAAWPG